MATIQKFEELEIWQLARALCKKVYPYTFQEPISKDFRFKDQIRGTSGSVMDNIAEGSGRGSRNEFINSLSVTIGKLDELKLQLYRGLDIGYFTQIRFDELYADADLIDRKTTTFITYFNDAEVKGQKFKNRKK